MIGRYFLDTNIFVYSFEPRATAKARKASQLILRAVATGQGIISYQVVQEFFNVALGRFAQPMRLSEGEQYLATVFRPLLVVHSSTGLFGEALRLNEQHHLSWYDSLILAAAIEGQCGVLYSEDLQHGQRFGQLRVENPFM